MTVAPMTVDAPAVRPPLGGLLPVADVTEVTDGHYLFGLEYQSFLCEDGGYTAGCVDAPAAVPVDDVKEFAGSHIVDGVPVTVYAGVECDLFGAPYSSQAAARLAGSEDRLVAGAFYRHAALGAWNAGEAALVLPETVTQDNIVEAIAALEQYAGEHYAGMPVLHMNRATATYAIAADLVVPNIDGTLATLQGTPVANSAGYPDGVIFITGAVQLWRTPVANHTAPNLGTNTALALAERTYVMATDCLLAIAGGDDNGNPPDSLDLSVPSPIAVTIGAPTIYTTRLVNTGGPVDEATEVIRLSSTDRDLTSADVTYQTEDNGTWVDVDWFETEGDLVFTEVFPVPAGLNATSRVRIVVHAEDLTNLTGTSTITGDFGVVLAEESYVYDLSAAPAPAVTVTAVDPATGPVGGGTTVTITGTGFEG